MGFAKRNSLHGETVPEQLGQSCGAGWPSAGEIMARVTEEKRQQRWRVQHKSQLWYRVTFGIALRLLWQQPALRKQSTSSAIGGAAAARVALSRPWSAP